MRDFLLKCPQCDASLAFDHKLAGKELSCPACKERITVPVPDTSFACPACGGELHTTSDLSGEFECPACKGTVVMEGDKAGELEPEKDTVRAIPVATPSSFKNASPSRGFQIRRVDSKGSTDKIRSGFWAIFAIGSAIVIVLSVVVITAIHRGKVSDAYDYAMLDPLTTQSPELAISNLQSVIFMYPDAPQSKAARTKLGEFQARLYGEAFGRADQAKTAEEAIGEINAVMAKYPDFPQVNAAKLKIIRIKAEKKRQDEAMDAAIVFGKSLMESRLFELAESRTDKALKDNPLSSHTAEAVALRDEAHRRLTAKRKTDAAEDYGRRLRNRKPSDMVEFVRQCAELGVPEAQCDLGTMLAAGSGVPADPKKAAEWFLKAAQAGLAQAQIKVGHACCSGTGLPQDYAEAARWYRKAADQNEPFAQWCLGHLYEKGQGVPQDFMQAVLWYRQSAENGNSIGQASLGWLFINGMGVPKDYVQAAGWCRKSAEQGNGVGLWLLGDLYCHGLGVPKDYDGAIRWYRKAAEQGIGMAQHNLGCMYFQGWGVPQDYAEAAKLFRQGMAQGIPDSAYSYGLILLSGGHGVSADSEEGLRLVRLAAGQGYAPAKKLLADLGVASVPTEVTASTNAAGDTEQDPQSRALLERGLASQQRGDSAQAAGYFRQAADRGSAWGQNNLGCCYMQGDGVSRDAVEGAQWIAKAAAQGLREAQAALGTCYVQGWGVEKNVVEGARWFKKAAEQGDAVAQRQLCLLYAVGMGVPKSNREAVKWAREAATRGDAQAKEWIAKWDARQGSGDDIGGASPSETGAPSVKSDSQHPYLGHKNPWGQAGGRVVGTYATFNDAYRAKKGLKRQVEGTIDAFEEQISNAGNASMTVQRPPEYSITHDLDSGRWVLVEQKF